MRVFLASEALQNVAKLRYEALVIQYKSNHREQGNGCNSSGISKGISQMLEDMRSQNPIERIGRKLQLIFIKITYLIVIIKMKMLSDRKVDRVHMQGC